MLEGRLQATSYKLQAVRSTDNGYAIKVKDLMSMLQAAR
jgi:hypothetical protein